jgi:hypothetical protein
LQKTLKVAERADFCVGYFNLRGWRYLADFVDSWPGGDGHCCRLLGGMNGGAERKIVSGAARAKWRRNARQSDACRRNPRAAYRRKQPVGSAIGRIQPFTSKPMNRSESEVFIIKNVAKEDV